MIIESVLNVFADGGARGNPGPAAIGLHISDEKGNVLYKYGEKIGRATNNVAEYSAVIRALSWMIANRKRVKKYALIQVFLDSQLVVAQLQGRFKVKDAKMKELYAEVCSKEKELDIAVCYTHIPREENSNADKMVNLALDNKIN